jgi:isopenicillin N synthase-like dioxygenase
MEQSAFQFGGSCAREQHFVRKVLRALKEIGAFYIIGHGLPSDLFDSMVQANGHLPWKDDAEGGDGSFKLNLRLRDTRSGLNAQGIQNIADGTGLPVPVLSGLVDDYFERAELLSHHLLHIMAVAQGLLTGDFTPAWRGAWRDGNESIGLRALFYHPGPRTKSSGSTVKTTARHTDATWLTLLRNDDCDGLHIGTEKGDVKVIPPTSSKCTAGQHWQRFEDGDHTGWWRQAVLQGRMPLG